LPSARSAEIWYAQRAIAAWSRPRPSLVTSEEPTLTMMRPACWMTEVVVLVLLEVESGAECMATVR
jgi:hypothetical protein